jgi:hypothetical protein
MQFENIEHWKAKHPEYYNQIIDGFNLLSNAHIPAKECIDKLCIAKRIFEKANFSNFLIPFTLRK